MVIRTWIVLLLVGGAMGCQPSSGDPVNSNWEIPLYDGEPGDPTILKSSAFVPRPEVDREAYAVIKSPDGKYEAYVAKTIAPSKDLIPILLRDVKDSQLFTFQSSALCSRPVESIRWETEDLLSFSQMQDSIPGSDPAELRLPCRVRFLISASQRRFLQILPVILSKG